MYLNIFKKKKVVVVHGEGFHSDDVFACAIFSLLFRGRIKIIRTRDQALIDKADFVADVGGVYDPEKNRFDHHQIGGAGERENTIPYASFGLVWKKYGEELCGSKEVALLIDQKLVQPIDANDNGIDITKNLFEGIISYRVQDIFHIFSPTWQESKTNNQAFLEMVNLAKQILKREIIWTKDFVNLKKTVKDAYEKTENKKLVIFDNYAPREDRTIILSEYEEPLYFVFPNKDGSNWRLVAVIKNKESFLSRKPLPKSWAGKREQKLEEASGVEGAFFCHNSLFMVATKTKEGALKLAEKALLG